MSEPGNGTASRWWRRGRDQAQQAARAAHGVASQAMMRLDTELHDLPNLIAAYEDSQAAQTHPGRSRSAPPLLTEWAALSVDADAAIGAFVALIAEYNPTDDLDEGGARRFEADFHAAARAMDDVLPRVQQFLARHADPLRTARSLVAAVPRAFDAAVAALSAAQQAVAAAQTSGVVDSSLTVDLQRAVAQATSAEEARARRQLPEAIRLSDAAAAQAREVQCRAQTMQQRLEDARKRVLSLRTRKEALESQHARLQPVMSELRRRFSYASWKHIDDVPTRAQKDLLAVTDGILALDRMLAADPVDLAVLEPRVAEVRDAAAHIGEYVKTAQDTLARLEAVAADPSKVLAPVERKLLDVRRFLRNLPASQQQRYAATFDALAMRYQRLMAEPREVRPNWGHVLSEADAIAAGLDLLVRTARG